MDVNIKDVLRALTQLYSPELDDGTNFSIRFNLTGDEPATYSIRIENKHCEFIEGGIENPKVIVITKPATWIAIASGEMNPMNAIMMGRLNVKGNFKLLLSLEDIFSAIPEGFVGHQTGKRKGLWEKIMYVLDN